MTEANIDFERGNRRNEKEETEDSCKEENTKEKKEQEIFHNSKLRDSSGKLIFKDSTLCDQFLRDYTNIPQLKIVQPEDIEDVSERYIHMFAEERNSDVVKKVKIRDDEIPFYLISITEHKSNIDYNTVMQILRYMIFIWEDYEKEQNKRHPGIAKTKKFRYPPILPLIFYDGIENWTAALQLKERIYLSDMFAEYIPDYKCMLVQIQDYSSQKIMENKDELSILMLINKLRKTADFKTMEEEISPEYLKTVTENTSEYLLGIMAEVVSVLLYRLKLPQEEVDDFMGQIKERKMGELFTHFEGYDVPAMRIKLRKEIREEIRDEVREEVKDEVREEVKDEVREEVKDENIKIFIKVLKELGISKESIETKLISKHLFDKEKVNLYW